MSSVYSNYIKRMRMCANENCKGCSYAYEGLTNTEECKEDLLYDAAEQLEDAYKCNARLVKKCKEMEKRIAELEAQMPKQGEWIVDKNGYPQIICSICDVHIPMVAGWCMDAHINYCPNCGAKMKNVTDCHTLEEGEQHGES